MSVTGIGRNQSADTISRACTHYAEKQNKKSECLFCSVIRIAEDDFSVDEKINSAETTRARCNKGSCGTLLTSLCVGKIKTVLKYMRMAEILISTMVLTIISVIMV